VSFLERLSYQQLHTLQLKTTKFDIFHSLGCFMKAVLPENLYFTCFVKYGLNFPEDSHALVSLEEMKAIAKIL